MARRLLVSSLIATIVGIGLAIPAFSAPPGAGASSGSGMTYRPSTLYGPPSHQYVTGYTLSATRGTSRPPIGYPCTWSGSRDLAHGETAYQGGRYVDAATQWKTAASKDCAIAAYKLGMLYYGGKPKVAADRSLGAAWLRIAAESRTGNRHPYYQEMSQLAIRTLTESQRTEYTADYARLRASLGLPAAG